MITSEIFRKYKNATGIFPSGECFFHSHNSVESSGFVEDKGIKIIEGLETNNKLNTSIKTDCEVTIGTPAY